MQIRFIPNKIIFFLMLIFPVSTVYQGLPGLDALNRIIAFALLILMVISFFVEKMLLIDAIEMIVLIFLSAVCIIYTGKAYFANTLIQYPFWVIFMIYISNNYLTLIRELVDNHKLFTGITLFWEATVFISMFFPISYSTKWGDTYFISFSSGLHRLAMTCLTIMIYVFIMIQIYKDYRLTMLLVIPFVSVLMTGTRTYLAVSAVLLVGIYYVLCHTKKKFYLTIVPLLFLFALIIAISPMASKIESTMAGDGYFGYWATVTNGRNIFWMEDIIGYLELDNWRKVVGNGANFIYDLNLKGSMTAMIWAHNDMINILCTNGWLGLLQYFSVFFSFVGRYKKKSYTNTIIPMFVFYFVLGFNAMFNMLYTYTAAVIAIPFLFFSLITLPNEYETYRVVDNENNAGFISIAFKN